MRSHIGRDDISNKRATEGLVRGFASHITLPIHVEAQLKIAFKANVSGLHPEDE